MITYKEAGVNIEEGYKAVSMIKNHAKNTMNGFVLNNIGSFAAMVEIPSGYKNPVLVSGTDGVGTKLQVAFSMNKYDSFGIDCVAMCVNDILCHGAKPLFFLDYIACGKLESSVVADIVKGVSEGCLMADCALVGGETAEMPGFYKDGEYDIAGFAVGVVDKKDIINGKDIKEGDAIIGITSSGPHSNGYSLIRKLVEDLQIELEGEKLGDILLKPTRIYVKPILNLLNKFKIKGMAHITGGGFFENIPRMMPKGYSAKIDKNSYEVPYIFKYLMEKGVDENHAYNTFNMGIGFVLCVDNDLKEQVIEELRLMGEEAYVIGSVISGGEGLCLE